MKTFYPFLLFILFSLTTQAQSGPCSAPNGDFEEWIDFSASISNLLPENTLLLPVGVVPIQRVNLISQINNLIPDLVEANVPNDQIAQTVFGITQTMEASRGEFAMKMKGDSISHETDFIMVEVCGGTPEGFRLDFTKDIATSDTLIILVYAHNNTNLPIGDDGFVATDQISAFFEGGLIIDQVVPEYVFITGEMDVNDNGISPDTVIVQMTLSSGQDTKSMEYPSYNLDNFRFTGTSTSTADQFEIETLKVYPSLAQDIITVSAGRPMQSVRIFSMDGRLGKLINTGARNLDIDVGDLLPGKYFIQANFEDGMATSRFVKSQ